MAESKISEWMEAPSLGVEQAVIEGNIINYYASGRDASVGSWTGAEPHQL